MKPSHEVEMSVPRPADAAHAWKRCFPPVRAIQLGLAPALIFALACEPPRPEPVTDLTRRQKDSVVAQSGLPGAKGVEKALNVLQASEDRAAALEQATR